jgi:hypothetical protein
VIRFDERDRRAIAIPSLAALEQVVHLAGAAEDRKLH